MKDLARYSVGTISLDINGMLWVQILGEHPEQGGHSFGYGSYGFENEADATNFIKAMLIKNMNNYKQLIEKKTTVETTKKD